MSIHGERADGDLELLLLGDSCSGVPGARPAANFRALVEAILMHAGPADALCYLGDHVAGYVASDVELRAQWRHFLDAEFRPLAKRYKRIHHLPSNHTAYDAISSAIYDEMLSDAERNGAVARKGLNYAVRDERALLVFLNTADLANRGDATIDVEWLHETLDIHSSAPLKLVFGHHPIHPVNGYGAHPLWRVSPELGRRAWSLLREAGVSAYICSHILAFDFQVRDGVIQLCSGGGGTEYGPGGLMPAASEYHHFVECVFRPGALRCRVYDVNGRLREAAVWPIALEDGADAVPLTDSGQPFALPAPPLWRDRPADGGCLILSFSGVTPDVGPPATILCGWRQQEGPPVLWIGFEGATLSLVVKAVPAPGRGQQVWVGPSFILGQDFEIELALLPAAGPGGVLARVRAAAWSSLASNGAEGLSRMAWPELWAVGNGPEGRDDAPYRGAVPRGTMATFAPGADRCHRPEITRRQG
jgi:hypothetical protein